MTRSFPPLTISNLNLFFGYHNPGVIHAFAEAQVLSGMKTQIPHLLPKFSDNYTESLGLSVPLSPICDVH